MTEMSENVWSFEVHNCKCVLGAFIYLVVHVLHQSWYKTMNNSIASQHI